MPAQADRDAVTVMRVELTTLAGALAEVDKAAIQVALATIAQQVHALQLTYDSQQNTCPRITLHNGQLVARYTEDVR